MHKRHVFMLIIKTVAERGNTDCFSRQRKQYFIYVIGHPSEKNFGFLPDPTFYLTPEVWFSAFLSTSVFLFQWLS